MSNTNITNININYTAVNPHIALNYLVESTDTIELFTSEAQPQLFIPNDMNSIQFVYGDNDVVVSNKNMWKNITDSDGQIIPLDINIKPHVKKFNIYFPRHRVSTYSSIYMYVIQIHTFINGRKVNILNKIIDIRDALACAPKRYNSNNYYEYISIETIDPAELCYSDSFKDWRETYLGEGSGINNTGASTSITITPVDINNDNVYIKTQYFNPGNGTLMLGDIEDFIITQTINKSNHCINMKLSFNKYYDDTNDGFVEFLKETYFFNIDPGSSFNISYDIAILNRESNVLHSFYSDSSDYIYNGNNDWLDGLVISKDFTFENLEITNWESWGEGYNMVCSFSIFCNEEEVISIDSNEIACTTEVYSYLLPQPSEVVYSQQTKIYLDNIDMNEIRLDVVNKVNKTTVTVNGKGTGSSIIKPVFYKSFETSDITLYRMVKQNIGINLDNYKSKTDKFYIMIDGLYILEKARVTGNIIFNIDGTKLPSISEGNYFVCDANKELITSGKFNIL